MAFFETVQNSGGGSEPLHDILYTPSESVAIHSGVVSNKKIYTFSSNYDKVKASWFFIRSQSSGVSSSANCVINLSQGHYEGIFSVVGGPTGNICGSAILENVKAGDTIVFNGVNDSVSGGNGYLYLSFN